MSNDDKMEIININKSTVLYGLSIGVAVSLIIVYLATHHPNWFVIVLFLILVLNVVETCIAHKRLKVLLDKMEECNA